MFVEQPLLLPGLLNIIMNVDLLMDACCNGFNLEKILNSEKKVISITYHLSP